METLDQESRSNLDQYRRMISMGMLSNDEGRVAIFCRGRLLCIEDDNITATLAATVWLDLFEGHTKGSDHQPYEGYIIKNDLMRAFNDD